MWTYAHTTAYVYDGNTSINVIIHTIDYSGTYDANAHKKEGANDADVKLVTGEKGKENFNGEDVDFGYITGETGGEARAISNAKKYGRT